MHRDIDTLNEEINAQRQQITRNQQQLKHLEAERKVAVAMLSAAACQRARMTQVLERFHRGEAIVATPRAWWHLDGQLIEQATGDDLEGLRALQDHGVIESHRQVAA